MTTTLTSTLFAIVGSLIAARARGNRIAWLMLGIGATFAVAFLGGVAVALEMGYPGSVPGARYLDKASSVAWYLMLGLLWPQVLLLFPDGQLPSPRWRIVAAVQAGVLVLLGILILAPPTAPRLPDGVGIEALAPLATLVDRFGYPVVLALLCAGAGSMVIRFRRSRNLERAQLKWVAFVALLVALGFLASAVTEVFVPVAGEAIGFVTFILLALLPLSIGAAILRYRLYEIDRLISRTIGWAVVTGILLAVFAGAVIGLQALLAPWTGNNTLAIAGSTLIAAALFAPLRTRVQRAVDRRFNRSRVDAQVAVEDFGGRLRDEVDLAAVSGLLVGAAGRTVQPRTVGLWTRPGGSGR